MLTWIMEHGFMEMCLGGLLCKIEEKSRPGATDA